MRLKGRASANATRAWSSIKCIAALRAEVKRKAEERGDPEEATKFWVIDLKLAVSDGISTATLA